jgi:MFS family permease
MKRTSVGAVFLTVVVDLVGFGIVLPLLPLYARDFRATPFQIGALIASFSAMQFLFAPVWGRISDRIGRRPVLLVGLAGSVVFYTVFGFADSVGWLFLSRIGAGICGATISTSAAYIADVTPPEQRVRGMALIGAAFGIGFTLGPPLGFYAHHLGEVLEKEGSVSHAVALSFPGLVAAAISAASLVWTWTSVGEPPRHRAEGRRLLDLEALRTARSPRAVVLLLLFSFLSVTAFSNFESTLSLMLDGRFGMDPPSMGHVFLFVGVTLAVAQGFLVRRVAVPLGEPTLVRTGFALMAAGLLGVAYSDTVPPLLASLAVSVTGFAAVTPSFSSLVSRQGSAKHQGGMMGMAQSASALGRILGPILGNLAFQPHDAAGHPLASLPIPLLGPTPHHRLPYLVGAAMAAALALASIAWMPGAPGKEDPPPSG